MFYILKKPFTFLLLIVFQTITQMSFGQKVDFSCGAGDLHEYSMKHNKVYHDNFLKKEAEQYAQKLITKKPSSKIAGVLTIPVVVHIIHNNGPENISDPTVISIINELNKSFAAISPYNGQSSVDTEIRFCLAKQDPSGNATTGITRDVDAVNTSITYFDPIKDQAIKNIERWDTKKYLNIWVIKDIVGSTAGYAYMASAHGSSYDGVIVEYGYYNVNVLSHEIGHYLNLFHTFEGGCLNNNCLLDGDKVCDTPPDGSKGTGCGPINSCITDADDASLNNPFRPSIAGGIGDQNDYTNNYMDYSPFSCQNAFTAGQKDRMRTALEGTRASLLSSLGCENPCITPIAFNLSITGTTEAGFPVTIINTSTNTTSYNWYINGSFFNNTINLSTIFSTSGKYKIKLQASNSNPSCSRDTSFDLLINCSNINVSFSNNNATPLVGDLVTFTNLSTTLLDTTGKNKWYLNGILISNAKNLSYLFNTRGTYTVKLEVGNTTNFCAGIYEEIFVVKCQAVASFTPTTTKIPVNAGVNFTNTSSAATAYEWLVNNVSEATTVNFNRNFTSVGDYVVSLVAKNGLCNDTTYQAISVYDPLSCNNSNKQSTYWYFGSQAGITFASGSPVALTNSSMYASAGSASISNKNGNLLFYTNGTSVWNKLHALMPGGTGLAGSFSSTHAALIVPAPQTDTLFYIFTTSEDNIGSPSQLKYSMVNMNLGTGLGDVITASKNTSLLTPSGEKVAAAMHGNGCDVWVIGQKLGTNEFYAWYINSVGIASLPVISSSGPVINMPKGEIKISSDGLYLAIVEAPSRDQPIQGGGGVSQVALYDFDNFTGQLTFRWQDLNYKGNTPYGICFSPLVNNLYVTTSFQTNGSQGSFTLNNLFQYNLNAGSNVAVVASRNAVLTDNNTLFKSFGSIQPASNGLLYFSYNNSTQLGAVKIPEITGASCNANNNEVPLAGKLSTWGLPSFLNSQSGKTTIEYICQNGFTTQFSFSTSLLLPDDIYWDFGDPASGTSNISTDPSPTHTFTSPGTFHVKLILRKACMCAEANLDIVMPLSCTLPVCLLNFTGSRMEKSNLLVWETLPGCNIQKIELEKSIDTKEFYSTGQKKLSENKFYDYEVTPGGNYYYRLKIYIDDNQYHYSKIIYLNDYSLPNHNKITIFPVPSENWIMIKMDYHEKIHYNCIELTGKSVMEGFISPGDLINISDLASGMYIIQVRTNNCVLQQRFIKL